MAKKKSLPGRQAGKKKTKKPALAVQQKTQESEIGEDQKFDFGGLPMRDLKKNLGCG